MGTRNLTCVHHEGKYKVAQYCQWDGNPGRQGLTVLNFLRKTDLVEFTKKLANVRFADDRQIEALWINAGAERGADGVSMAVADNLKKEYPQLSRDTGAGILDLIMNAKEEILLKDSIDFVNDSLFCEWCYVIDIDKGVFEVHAGFNKKPLGPMSRFADAGKIDTNGGYFPVKLRARFKLDALPDEKEFLRRCGK